MMRRLVPAVVVAAAVATGLGLAGLSGGHGLPAPITSRAPHTPHLLRINRTALECVSVDCGPYTATLNWSLPAFQGLTGYNLLLNGSQVSTSLSSPFVFSGLDCGTTVTLGVQPHGTSTTGSTYSTSYTSPACGVAPSELTEPVVSGTVSTGSVLTTTNGTWSGTTPTLGYQWQDCGTDGASCSNITGATSSTYTVASGDAGHSIEAVVTATNGIGSASAGAPIVPLMDEFSGSSVNTDIWIPLNQQGDTSNNEFECYLPSHLSEGGGDLTESATFDSTGQVCPSGTPNDAGCTGTCATVQGGGTDHWLSGNVEEKQTTFLYGTITARVKMAGPARTAWPAVWLLGAACQSPNFLTGAGYYCGATPPAHNWPQDGLDAAEIDVAEGNSGSLTSMLENVFNSTGSVSSACGATVTDYSANFHTYELDWTAGSIVFKVDGTIIPACGITGAGVPSHPMFAMIDTAIHPTTAVSGDLPASTIVDWVHISH